MERAVKVKEKAREIVDKGNKPSVSKLSDEVGISEADVHRCLNFLEKQDEVETYTKEVFGRKHRMVGVKRK